MAPLLDSGLCFPLTFPQTPHLVAGLQQIVEFAFGLQAAIFEYQDVIGATQGRTAMGDD